MTSRGIAFREEKARKAGYQNWEQAIRGTHQFSAASAAARLGVTQGTIRTWRRELGLSTSSREEVSAEERRAEFQADLSAEGHGTHNGYKNKGCRCAACTEAWRVYCLYRRTGR